MTDVLSPVEDRSCDAAPVAAPAGSSAPRPQLVPDPPATAPASKPERAAELELMRAVAAHEQAAEATLVRRVIGLVRARARLLTRCDADADDATQTALVEILRSAKSYRGEGALTGWCERIAIRTTLRLQRSQARRVAAIDDAVNPDHISPTAPEPELAETIPGGEVESYLLELSDERHQALVLRHVLGLSVDEIAEQTGVSPNTVKDRLRMARKHVRQSIRQREVIASIRSSCPLEVIEGGDLP